MRSVLILMAALIGLGGSVPELSAQGPPKIHRENPKPRRPGPPHRRRGLDLINFHPVDLTYTIDEKTPFWPTAPGIFQYIQLHAGPTEAGHYYSAGAFCMPEHGGTHVDAPAHFAEDGQSVDKIDLDHLMGPAVVIDISEAAAKDADYRLSVKDIEEWERKNGVIPAAAIVLLRTGWGANWPDPKSYLGSDLLGDASKLHFPSYGKSAAKLLIKDRKVGALGVDTASIDGGQSQSFPVHRLVAKAGRPGLENLANLDKLPLTGAWVMALPMKIGGGSGGPARVLALAPN